MPYLSHGYALNSSLISSSTYPVTLKAWVESHSKFYVFLEKIISHGNITIDDQSDTILSINAPQV